MVGIVLVNYNDAIDTAECVNSLLKSSFRNYHIVIVDNNSNDNSYNRMCNDILVDQYDEINVSKYFVAQSRRISIINNPHNSGYAGGNNIGINYLLKKFPHIEYVWCLNNDTIVLENTLSELYYNAQSSTQEKVGIWGSKLMYFYSPEKIQSLGGMYNKYSCTTKSFADGLTDVDTISLSKFKPDFIVGASMFVDVEFIKEVGVMCEDYFLYFEELDWALRGATAGWKIDNIYSAVVYHKDGASTRRNSLPSEIADVCMVRNRLLFTSKFNKKYLWTVIIFVLATIFKRFLLGHFKRSYILLKTLCYEIYLVTKE